MSDTYAGHTQSILTKKIALPKVHRNVEYAVTATVGVSIWEFKYSPDGVGIEVSKLSTIFANAYFVKHCCKGQ